MIGTGGAITRHFAQLDDVLMSHYVYANTLVFASGDTFEFEFLAPTSTVSANQYLTDSDANLDRAFFLLSPDGTYSFPTGFTMTVDGVAIDTNSVYTQDGKLHKVVMSFEAVRRIGFLGVRYDGTGFYNGIITNPVATISGVTTTNTLGLATGNSEPSAEASNTITYVNIPDSNRELFQNAVTQWDNISPLPQELPAVIEIA
jgi:hypothetical protein